MTDRLELVPGSLRLIEADLDGASALSRALPAHVPPDWPPPLYDDGARRFALRSLRDGLMDDDWCFYYVVAKTCADRGLGTAVGMGGFKSRPTPAGAVEIGYSILPAFQRRGLAGEAVRAWVEFALGAPTVQVVVAQTLAGLTPSIRVAERVGFRYAGAGDDAAAPAGDTVLRYELRR